MENKETKNIMQEYQRITLVYIIIALGASEASQSCLLPGHAANMSRSSSPNTSHLKKWEDLLLTNETVHAHPDIGKVQVWHFLGLYENGTW